MMRTTMMVCALLAGAFWSMGRYALAGQGECNIFAISEWGSEQVYQSCEECLEQSQRCERRCFETMANCTAMGYDGYGFRSMVQGTQEAREDWARNKALLQCKEQGLQDCTVAHCTSEKSLQAESIMGCPSLPGERGRGSDRDRERDRAEYRCGIFPTSPQAPQREYPDCAACVQKHGQCAERCAQAGYVCTAAGYGRQGFRETLQGDLADSRQRAEQRALLQCKQQALQGCTIDQCTETMQFDPDQVRPCKTQATKKKNKQKPRPRVAPQASQRYVRSWQHLKGACEGRPHYKIAQQCGNRGFWQGISCRVTWSDGSTEDLHGKVDLTDPYGRAYCTRSSRPARFNCVSRCDDSNGPLMTLAKP